MCLLWLYFTVSEFLTTFYGAEPSHMEIFNEKLFGAYAPHFWTMVLTCFVIPFIILCNSKTRTIWGTVIASISVNIGMYLERFIIVVPSLSNPRLPSEPAAYGPTWVTKFFPIVSIWEIKEGREKAVAEVTRRVRETLPSSDQPRKSELDANDAPPR
jgi:molybdopterin-containing oxidoreductase family membrane subunit